MNLNKVAKEISDIEKEGKKVDIAQIKDVMNKLLIILGREWCNGNEAEVIKVIKNSFADFRCKGHPITK